MKLGAAAHDAWRSSALVKLTLPEAPSKGEREKRVDFTFVLDRAALNKVPPRGPIPVALELGRYRSGEAVGVLPAVVRRARTGLHSLRSPSRINTPYSPNSDGACPSRPHGAPCKIRRRIVGQTFYIRPLNPLRFLLPTRPRAKDRLGSGAVHSPDHRDMKVPTTAKAFRRGWHDL